MVPALRAAPLHRHRRGAHLPRHLRQPRRQRPAPAAAHLRPLRLGAAHRLLLGDHRQPGRAGRDPDRAALPRHRPQRRAPGRAARRRPRPAAARSADRRAPGSARARLPGGARLPARRSPDHRLRPRPGRGGAAAHLAARGAARGPRSHRPGARLSQRLPAHRAARHRGGPAQRRGPRRRQHQRARAGHRHRPPRRRHPGRLPGHHRRHLAADGPRRSARRAERGHPRRRRGRPGPLRGQPPGATCSRPRRRRRASTRRTSTCCWPTCARRPSSCPSSPASASAAPPRTTCSPSSPRKATCARRTTGAGTGRARTSRPRRSTCASPRRRTCSSSTPGRERPRVLGEVDLFAARVLVHEKAIYLHDSRQYHVDRPRLGGAQGARAPGRRRLLHAGGAGGHAQAARGLRRSAAPGAGAATTAR